LFFFFCYSCSTRVEKEQEKITTQEQKKLANKRNPRNSMPGRRKTKKNLSLSTLSDIEEFFYNQLNRK
jgi:hypothetical protein